MSGCASAATRSACATRRARRSTASPSAGSSCSIVILAVAGRFALAGIGPFDGVGRQPCPTATAWRSPSRSRTREQRRGQTTCRVTDPADRTSSARRVRAQPADRAGGRRVTFTQHMSELGRPSGRSRPTAAPRDGTRHRGRGRRRRHGAARLRLGRRARVRARAGRPGRDRADGPLRASRAHRLQERPGRRDRGGPPVRGADPRRDPGALPGRCDACRGDRRAQGEGGRGADLGAWPGLDRRPPRRDGQLRQRHPGLLRLDRSRRRWPARRSGSSSTRPGPRRSPRPPMAPRPSTGARSVPRRRRQLSDFVISMALNGRTAATRGRNVRKAIRIRATWARPRSPWRTSRTAGSTRSSSRAGCPPGTSPRPG